MRSDENDKGKTLDEFLTSIPKDIMEYKAIKCPECKREIVYDMFKGCPNCEHKWVTGGCVDVSKLF